MSARGWKTFKIGELGRVVTGKTPPTEDIKNFGNKYPFITPRDMTGQKKIGNTERYLSENGKLSVKNCLLPPDAVCVSCIGSDMGKVVMTTQDSVTNQQLNSIICSASFNPNFVYYSIIQISDELRNTAHHSTAVPILNKKAFSDFEIEVPDLSTQTRIAAFLSALDDKIELNRQTNATLEAIAQAIFKEWFVDFRFPGATGEMQDSELGPIPKGWRIGKLGELSYVQNGFAFKSKDFSDTGELGIIKIKNICAGIIDILSTQYVSSEVVSSLDNKFEVTQEALLIAMTGAEVGKIGLMPYTDKKFWLNQRVGMFVERVKNSNWYVYLLLSAKEYQETIRNSALGSAQPNISGDSIQSVKVLLPPNNMVQHFGEIVKPVFEKILYNISENHQLAQTRDILLPKLMSGDI